jgi:hydroxymethylbilane synthase
VDTRVRKLQSGEVDAIIIAAAGLLRLAQENLITELIPFDIILPAPCQGALAIEIREGDLKVRSLVRTIDHAATRASIMAERAFLRGLGGGCSLPVGALASVRAEELTLKAQVVSPDGGKKVQRTVSGRADDADTLGKKLAQDLLNSEGPWFHAALKSPER